MEMKMQFRDIEHYLQNKMNEEFNTSIEDIPNGIDRLITDFDTAVQDKQDSGFNTQCEIGVRIMTDNLDDGVFGSAKKKRYYDNSIKSNIKRKIAEMMTSNIDVTLKNGMGRIYPVSLMEQKINTALDAFGFIDSLPQIEAMHYYMADGWGKYGWDVSEDEDGWKAGTPQFQPFDTRDVWTNPGVRMPDKSDKTTVFGLIPYTTEGLKKKYPQFKDIITAAIDEQRSRIKASLEYNNAGEGKYPIDTTNKVSPALRRYLSEGITDVICCQRKYTFWLTVRELVNEDTGETVTYLEEDYQKHLLQVAESMDNPPEDISMLSAMAQDVEDNNIVTMEKVAYTKPMRRKFVRWGEVYFIPELQLILPGIDGFNEEGEGIDVNVKNVGDKCQFLVMPGDWNPDSSYSQSMAWENSKMLEMRSIILTIQMIYATRFHKPLLIIEPGAILNEVEFRKNYSDPDFTVQVNPEWRNASGGHNLTRDPFKFIYPAEMGRIAEILERKLDNWMDENTRSTDARQGIPSNASESGKAVALRQVASAKGDKTDFNKVTRLINEYCECMKDDIIKYMDDPHVQSGITESGDWGQVEVNTRDTVNMGIPHKNIPNEELSEIEVNNMLKYADSAFIRVTMNDNFEDMTRADKEEALMMYDRKLLSTAATVRVLRPNTADRDIKELREQEQGLAVAQRYLEDEEFRMAVDQVVGSRENQVNP